MDSSVSVRDLRISRLEEPMGADILLWLRIEATPLSARVPAGRRYQPGEPVRVGIDPAQVSLFDTQSEARL